MNKKFTCPKCGHDHFNVVESLSWKGWVDEEDPLTINLKNNGNDIDLIECAKCGEDIFHLVKEHKIFLNFT